jgi:hypothetical protein
MFGASLSVVLLLEVGVSPVSRVALILPPQGESPTQTATRASKEGAELSRARGSRDLGLDGRETVDDMNVTF